MPVHPNRGAIGRAAVIAVLVALSLGGCVPAQPVVEASPESTPSSSAAPVFASDAEALAAAEAAYAAYLAMSDLISQEGGRDPERIAPFVTEEQLVVELEGFASLNSSGTRLDGVTRLLSLDLQSAELEIAQSKLVTYACIDYSATMFIRPDGSVVQTVRQFSTVLVLVRFESEVDELGLRVAQIEPWAQDRECQ